MSKTITITINTIRGFASPALNFLIAIVGLKHFGKEDWGILIDILLWVYFILIITNWGNKEYLIRKYSREPSKVNYLFYSSVISRSPLLILSSLFLLFFPFNTAIISIVFSISLYLYSSLDSIIIHRQRFGIQLITDVVGFLIIICVIALLNQFSLNTILLTFIFSTLIKTLILVINLELIKEKILFKFSIKEIQNYLPFFLIAFSGWLATKVDMYLVTLHLNKSDVTEYQLLNSSFLMINAGFAFIVTPFSKHIYRLSINNINKIKKKLNLLAIPYLLIATISIWFIMEKILQLDMNINYYYISAIKTLFPLFFIIDIMILNKKNQEQKVTYIIIIGLIINLILILLLINDYKIIGVLISTCISRFILLLIYKWQTINL
jgi:O-antigen/teichoic acid export membrane protein